MLFSILFQESFPQNIIVIARTRNATQSDNKVIIKLIKLLLSSNKSHRLQILVV